jgi:hypothetical protein
MRKYLALLLLCFSTSSFAAITPQTFQGYQGITVTGVVATIAAGGTLSSAVSLNGFSLCAILLPATFTGATISFEASFDGTNYFPVYSTTSGTLLSYTVTQGHYVAIDPKDFFGIKTVKILSASTEGSTRTLNCSLKGI